ncbi:CRTAC1 family protein [Halosimplex amylolyticum]|uniref:CRTAC1 family protein n=1 Tax=Halosimplex amylolyticum TaxID=3396616 RepID=UPI003F57183A
MRRKLAAGLTLFVAALLLAGIAFVSPGAVADATDLSELRLGDEGDPSTPHIEFSRLGAERGFEYTSTFTPSDGMMGNAGVYASDYDGDGWTDVLALGGDRPVLFENDRGRFVRSGALPAVEGYVKSAHFLDYDADGDDDLLLLRSGDSPVFLENSGGSYDRVAVGLSDVTLDVPTGATSADFDGDGCLDLFIYQNGDWSDGFPGNSENRAAVLDGEARPNVTDGNPNLLFRGTCDGFENVTERAGIRGHKWTLAASFVDLTGDGRPDVHVANDFSHDVLYVNLGNDTFERVDLGPATDRNAMSSEIADLNGDGRLDVYVTNIYFTDYMHLVGQGGREVSMTTSSLSLNPHGNNLLVNRGNGTFADRAGGLGVQKGGWGWAASAVDLDNDGHRDLIHATSSDIPIVEYDGLGYERPQVWAGNGTGFAERNESAAGFDVTNGRGLISLDFDRDGELEVIVAESAAYQTGVSTAGSFAVYDNVGAAGRSVSIAVERDGVTSVGARVFVTTEERTRLRVLNARSDFFSQEPRRLHVGLGNETVQRVRVVWPDGTERSFADVPDGRFLTVTPDGVTAAGNETD